MADEVVTRTRETRRRAGGIIMALPAPAGSAQAQAWAMANLKMLALAAEQAAAGAEALEAIRDILLAIRADTP